MFLFSLSFFCTVHVMYMQSLLCFVFWIGWYVYVVSCFSSLWFCLIPCTYLVNFEISYFLFCRQQWHFFCICVVHDEMFIPSVVSWASVHTSRRPQSISVIKTNHVKVRKSSCKVSVTCVRFNKNPNMSENLREVSRIKLHVNQSGGSCDVPRREMDGRTEERTHILNCFVYALKMDRSEI